MEIITLSTLVSSGSAFIDINELIVTVDSSMIIEGEDRLSYTTIFRLVECCRELHWRRDIDKQSNDQPLDTICKSVTGQFKSPIIVGSVISIGYQLGKIVGRGYTLAFTIRSRDHSETYAEVLIDSIFYNCISHSSMEPPASLREHLIAIARG
jgi:acyl-CoA thioesterase FadM